MGSKEWRRIPWIFGRKKSRSRYRGGGGRGKTGGHAGALGGALGAGLNTGLAKGGGGGGLNRLGAPLSGAANPRPTGPSSRFAFLSGYATARCSWRYWKWNWWTGLACWSTPSLCLNTEYRLCTCSGRTT